MSFFTPVTHFKALDGGLELHLTLVGAHLNMGGVFFRTDEKVGLYWKKTLEIVLEWS